MQALSRIGQCLAASLCPCLRPPAQDIELAELDGGDASPVAFEEAFQLPVAPELPPIDWNQLFQEGALMKRWAPLSMEQVDEDLAAMAQANLSIQRHVIRLHECGLESFQPTQLFASRVSETHEKAMALRKTLGAPIDREGSPKDDKGGASAALSCDDAPSDIDAFDPRQFFESQRFERT